VVFKTLTVLSQKRGKCGSFTTINIRDSYLGLNEFNPIRLKGNFALFVQSANRLFKGFLADAKLLINLFRCAFIGYR